MAPAVQLINAKRATKPVSALIEQDAKVSGVSVFSDTTWDLTEKCANRTLEHFYKITWGNIHRNHWGGFYPLVVSYMEFGYACLFDPIEEDKAYNPQTVDVTAKCLARFLDYLHERAIYTFKNLTHQDIYDYIDWLVHQKDDADKSKAKYTLERIEKLVVALQKYYRYSKRVSEPLPIYPLHGQTLFKHLGKKRNRTSENRTPSIPKQIWDPYLRAALDYVEIYAPDILHGQAILENIRANALPKYVNLVVIACISGIREGETALLQIDGYAMSTSDDSHSKTYRITSWLNKGKNNKRVTWAVNEPVFRACEILREMTSYSRAETNLKELFIQGWWRGMGNLVGTAITTKRDARHGQTAVLPLGPAAMTKGMNRFAAHIQKQFGDLYALPLIDGKAWHFTMRQARRSLASRIAREPFGSLAGMLHYKHLKVTTFLGYAGEDPSWIKELHDEEIAANEEFLEQLWEDIQDGAVGGGKGQQLLQEFKGTAGEIKKNAMQYFIEHQRTNLHVGLLNYCFFEKDASLCLKDSKDNKADSPIMNACHPDRCANSCISKSHLPQWKVQVEEAKAMLSHKNLSNPQRIALTRDMEKALRIVNQLKGAS